MTDAPASQESADSLLLSLASDLRKLVPIEKQRSSLRITPHGLFVEEGFMDELVHVFQSWLREKSGAEVEKSEKKALRRLFGGEQPPRHYLIEGKLCLRGVLAPFKVQEPQKYQLPFFLGSLAAADQYLHPRDPVFSSLTGVEAIAGPSGTDIKITVKKRHLVVPNTILRELVSMLKHSPGHRHDPPQLTLVDGVRELLRILPRAKVARPNRGLLVPSRFANPKRYDFLLTRGFVFVCDKSGKVESCYEMRGSNFYHFLRGEFAALRDIYKSKRHGAFEFFDRRNEHLGRFDVWRAGFRLKPHAFLGFVANLHLVTRNKDRFSRFHTVKECFEELSSVFQTSQPIERRMIASHVEDKRYSSRAFRVNDGWIFVINRENVIEECIVRYRRLEHKKPARPLQPPAPK